MAKPKDACTAQVLSDLLPDKRPLDVTIAEGKKPLKIRYLPEALTQSHLDRLEALESEGDDVKLFDIYCVYLEMVGLEWDIVLEEGGDPIPCNAEGFRQVNSFLLPIIFNAIVVAERPKDQAGQEPDATTKKTSSDS